MRKAASLALLAALAAAPAVAQTLYKWVDADGKTQYSDKPPKGFKGVVIPIETEVDKTTIVPPAQPAPMPQPGAAPADKADKQEAPREDIAARRRATRERLEARLAKSREQVEAARKALAAAETPEPEERQVIQQRAAAGGMHGMTGRSNCRVESNGGQKWLMCPTFVPTEEYRERVARLEKDLKNAEDNLAAAEEAWRRGVD